MIGDDAREVFLTGATGFVGRHVLEELLAAGYRVRALARSGSARLGALEGCTTVEGDLLRPGPLARAMEGCRYLMHVAALYSFKPRDRSAIWKVNVGGTAGLLEAARIAGVEKVVMTSSSATLWRGEKGRYHASKSEQERVALAAQIPVVLVLPTAPVGPGDWKPTPTGQMIVDFMRGRIFGSVQGGLNVVAVEDVARAHVRALERGSPGKRYLAGGEDLTFDQLWAMLARVCGRRPPGLRLPHSFATFIGLLDEARCRILPGSRPLAPLEGVRMSRHFMYADSTGSQQRLGWRPGPVEGALARAVSWYRANGYA
jgi:dihydroflavonol-4-reductase